MVPFKGTLYIKQYIKNKPCSWGIKAFFLCGASGIIYDFLIYQGKTTELENYGDFGVSNAVVLKLVERIPEILQLYADNFFTFVELVKILKEKEIWYAGTIRKNRIMKYPLSITRKTARKTVNLDNSVVITQWADNNLVLMASNFVGKGETDKAKR